MDRINTNPRLQHYTLSRNKNFPNNRLPVLIYRNAINLPDQKNKAAAIVQQLVLKHNWSNSWRNGIYNFHHFHSNTHEAMIICKGSASVILGGPGGKRLKLKQGDLILLPAGTGHRCINFTKDFLCVGAYPQGKEYDMQIGDEQPTLRLLNRIKKVPVPKQDPIFGKEGFIKLFWHSKKG